MITNSSVEIDAPASTVWDVYVDVQRWPEWTASVTRIVPLDGPAIEVGHRFEITQPRFPKLVWEVTEVTPGTGWSWEQRSPGGTTVGFHEIVARGPERTLVRQGVDQRGPIGTLVGLLARKLTRRYLELESQGLKSASEARHRNGTGAAAS